MTIWPSPQIQRALAILCAVTLSLPASFGWQQGQTTPAAGQEQKLLPPEQLDSLTAPVALYPDPLLSQVLVASTYPLEIVEAARWLKQNSNLKGKDLAEAAGKQPWDASVQALVAFPDVLTQMDTGITWTTDLGNAFLAQQSDVMEAIQRLRQKAKQSGKLESTPQQTVTTGSSNNTTYVEIQPASPQVIYVPQYDPAVVWGAPPAYYPYPPVSTGAAVAAGAISFGVGMAIGAMWSGGGGWGWGPNWGHNTVVVNNTFINNNHFNRVNVANGNVWQHSAAHREGVPYANRDVANHYNTGAINQAGAMNRANVPTASQTQQRLEQANRQVRPDAAGQRQPGQAPANLGSAQRSMPDNRGSGMGAAGGGERIGNRQIGGSNFGGGGGGHAFGDVNQGGARANMNSGRGFSSMGTRGGGGRRR